MALSRGPSLDRMVKRRLTSAGRPHLSMPSSSRYAGQSRNIIVASLNPGFWVLSPGRPASQVYGDEP
jgi:hypothetical protein